MILITERSGYEDQHRKNLFFRVLPGGYLARTEGGRGGHAGVEFPGKIVELHDNDGYAGSVQREGAAHGVLAATRSAKGRFVHIH